MITAAGKDGAFIGIVRRGNADHPLAHRLRRARDLLRLLVALGKREHEGDLRRFFEDDGLKW